MFLTAHHLHNNLSHSYKIGDINTDYCIPETGSLIKYLKDSTYNDSIVVWEHKEIMDIIDHFLLPPTYLNKIWIGGDGRYDLIFMIDTINRKISYDCYDPFAPDNCDYYPNLLKISQSVPKQNVLDDQPNSYQKNYQLLLILVLVLFGAACATSVVLIHNKHFQRCKYTQIKKENKQHRPITPINHNDSSSSLVSIIGAGSAFPLPLPLP